MKWINVGVGMKWINVKDRLPDFDVPVLCNVAYLNFNKEYYYLSVFKRHNDIEGWLWYQWSGYGDLREKSNYDDCDDYDITHWMPLPEPPKDTK